MKSLRQIAVIFGIYFLGELIQRSLKLPIPGSVLGMLILLVLLSTGILKLDMIKETTNFLLDNLAFLFIPAGVGIISSFSILSGNLVAIVAVAIISTVIVIGTTGLIVQLMVRGGKK